MRTAAPHAASATKCSACRRRSSSCLAGRGELLLGELADELEHPEAAVGAHEQAGVGERVQRRRVGLTDALGRRFVATRP